jgi:F-type H+-transporting ATPase subunit b
MGVSIPEILTQAFAFILLVVVLKKFAWKPLLKMLDDRREKIRTGLDDIDKTKEEVSALKTDYERSRANIEEEARGKLQQAVDEGRKIAHDIQEKAREEARGVLDKAKSDIELEADKAKVTLRNEIANLTLLATEHLIKKKMDEKKDKELVLDFIKDVENIK